MEISNNLKLPLDNCLFNMLMDKISALESERLHLKMEIKDLNEKVRCNFSIHNEPEIMTLIPNANTLKLACKVGIYNDGNFKQHIICKTYNRDNLPEFSYFIDELLFDICKDEDLLMITANLHKRLMAEIIMFSMSKIKK